MDTLKELSIGFVAGVLLTLAAVLGWQYHSAQAPSIAVGPSKEVAKAATETVPCKSVQAYAAPVKRSLKLPADVDANPAAHVLASTTVAPGLHSQTVTTVLDTQTGISTEYVKSEPLAWFSTKRSTELSLAYGFNGKQLTPQLEVSEDLIQIKALHLGVTGQVEQGSRGFLGVRVALDF